MRNEMEIVFDAVSDNESFARVSVAAFVSHLNPTLEELSDIKTAVSEAVTNSIIHGYGNIYGYQKNTSGQGDETQGTRTAGAMLYPGKVRVKCVLEDEILHIEVSDEGKGIEDIEKAMEPLYTTRPELERSGMGFAFMEAFMDDLAVESSPGKGTVVRMERKMGIGSWIGSEE